MKSDPYTLDVPKPESYEEYRQQVRADSIGKSRQDIAAEMAANSEDVFDPETAVAPSHRWVDRGAVMSCEGAGHPSHRHFKVKR